MEGVRVTTAVARVLRIFLDDPVAPRYGFELMQFTRFPSGTLYPILARLERAGWISGRLETIDAAAEGRPPRRLYLLTTEGAQAAGQELAELSASLLPPGQPGRLRPEGGPAWA
jgi:PadR family transcriptional regulator, regulatory protein PadR